MLTFPLPTPVNGDLLAADLAAAGLVTRVYARDDLVVLPDLGAGDLAAAQPVVNGHPARAESALAQTAAASTNETSVRDKAAQALTANATDIGTNDTFLAIASPSNAQVATQVKELTRQSTRQARELNALIRLVLRRFEAAD